MVGKKNGLTRRKNTKEFWGDSVKKMKVIQVVRRNQRIGGARSKRKGKSAASNYRIV